MVCSLGSDPARCHLDIVSVCVILIMSESSVTFCDAYSKNLKMIKYQLNVGYTSERFSG